jgi:pSer/pThr/pTyr-binding forkhead associated (FHA) protein
VAASVYLKPLTPEARAALGGAPLEIRQFPFRVGRESRADPRAVRPATPAGRRPGGSSNNDLYLSEDGHPRNVSREHFLIDVKDGGYVIVDRGSSSGTIVEGEVVGEGKQGGWRRLNDQDVILVGTSESKFVFKFVSFELSG